MGWEIQLLSEAERCIEEQIAWFEEVAEDPAPTLADRWLEKLEATIAQLAENPERHGLAPENGRWRSGIEIRQVRFRPRKSGSTWRILFTLDAGASVVAVLQVRHAHRPLLQDGEDGEDDRPD